MSAISTILFAATIVLIAAGFIFSLLYIWLNATASRTDLDTRNTGIRKVCKTTMVLSLISSLLCCLLSKSDSIDKAISQAHLLYTVIAISWMAVLLASGIGFFIVSASKRAYKPAYSKEIKKLIPIAVFGVILGVVFAWLFS